ncbi:MAG: hypothetical protein IMZ46_17520, partial [Acidobacteria bacterium]|nr:hypothetical protein [Acidobacteriota bacterium]
LSASAVLLYVVSFTLKRACGVESTSQFAAPLLALVSGPLGAVAWQHVRRPGERFIGSVDCVRGAAFLLLFGLLAGPHLSALHGYSSDPARQIALANQVGFLGLVPDYYIGTRLPIDYPLGTAVYANALIGPTALPAASAINLLPVLANAVFLYLLVCGLRALTPPKDQSVALGDEIRCWFLVLAFAWGFNCTQFAIWPFYEGTGRLAAGLVHIVPVILLLAQVYANQIGHQHGEQRRVHGSGVRVLVLLVAGGLTCMINATHLILQGLLSLLVLVWELLKVRRGQASRRIAALLTGAVIGTVLVGIFVLTDPYTYRPVAKRFHLAAIDHTAVLLRNADFNQRLQGSTCLTATCLANAAMPSPLIGAFFNPLGTVGAGPVERLQRHLGLPATTLPGFLKGWSFPDFAGWNLAPVHGWTPDVLIAVPLVFVLFALKRRAGPWPALAALFGVAAIDSAIRLYLVLLINPLDAPLRLLPPYAARASSVFWSQTIWPWMMFFIWRSLGTERSQSRVRRIAWVVCNIALVIVLVSSYVEIRGRFGLLAPRYGALSAADIQDLRTLEEQVLPPGDSYLVAAAAGVVNLEKWIDPVDDAADLYLQAKRPTLFLYFLSKGARYSASELEATCVEFQRGTRYPTAVAASQARWALVRAEPGVSPDQILRDRRFCGRPAQELFPDLRAAGSRGKITVFRLW